MKRGGTWDLQGEWRDEGYGEESGSSMDGFAGGGYGVGLRREKNGDPAAQVSYTDPCQQPPG